MLPIIKKIRLPHILLFGSICLLFVFLFWRYKLGIVRYFDNDEFMYPNWSYHMLQGVRPYIDFMMFVPPLYLLFLMPIFSFWQGTDPLIVGRMLAFIISIMLSGSVMYLFWLIRGSWIFILAGLFFFAIPMPGDKFLEIRPDNLSLLFFLLGLIFQIKWMKNGRSILLLFIGLFYALSLLTLQKTAPLVVVSLVFSFISIFTNHKKHNLSIYFKFLGLGILMVISPFFLWAVFSGNPGIIFYSIFKLPIEASKMFIEDSLPTLFFFGENNTYYGQWGKSIGFIANSIFWALGSFISVVRIFCAVFPASPARFAARRAGGPLSKIKWEELMIGVLTVASLVIYLVSPIKFPQYLIIPSLFIVWNMTDGVYWVWDFLKKKRLWFIFYGFYILMSFSLYKIFLSVSLPKLSWTNAGQLDYIDDVLKEVPRSEYIFDLDGRTLYYPYPHYVCCLPYNGFRRFVSVSIPSIKESLIRTNTKYISGYPLRLISFSPEDDSFIKTNFIKINESFYETREPPVDFIPK